MFVYVYVYLVGKSNGFLFEFHLVTLRIPKYETTLPHQHEIKIYTRRQ